MDRFIPLIVNLALILSPLASAATVDPAIKKQLAEINARYDDFFRWIKARDERYERSQVATGERKKAEKAHAEFLERAREKYVKERKAKPDMEPLRLKWEQQVKEEKEQMELLRRRYVERRNEVEQYLKKGRTIPEMKEYDLEGY
jgi:hypothetical protein